MTGGGEEGDEVARVSEVGSTAGRPAGAGAAPALRASDADRDRVVDVLRVAAGEGRLTVEELGERVGAALSARTLGELAGLTADLPEDGPVAADVVRIEQRGGSARRDDGWVVPRRMEIVSSLGEVVLDFTRAVIPRDALEIDLDLRFGTLRLLTRPGIVIDTDGLVVEYGKVRVRPATAPGAPVDLRIAIRGELGYGKVVARPVRRIFGR
jgi:hypothetical protein